MVNSILARRVPIVRGRVGLLLVVVVGGQLALAAAVSRSSPDVALALTLFLGLGLVSIIEPRLTFFAPLIYLMFFAEAQAGFTPADAIIVLPAVVVVASALGGGEIAARAWALLRAHAFKLAIAVFVVLVLIAVARAYASPSQAGANQAARMALAPLLLFSLAVFRDRRDLMRSLRITFYTYAVLQTGRTLYYLATGGSETGSAIVSTGGARTVSNSSAMFLGMVLVLAALHLVREERFARSIGLSLLMLVSIAGITLALARTTWIALAVLVVALLALLPEARRAAAGFLATVTPLIVLGALLVPVLAPDQVDYVRDRLEAPDQGTVDNSFEFRRIAWGLMLERWEENPWVGQGFGQTVSFPANDGSTFVVTNDPHSGFIFLLTSLGIVGIAVFALVQLGFVRMCWRAIRSTPLARDLGIWTLAAWALYMANAATGVVFGVTSLMVLLWYFLAVPVAVAALPDVAEEPARSAEGSARDHPLAPAAAT